MGLLDDARSFARCLEADNECRTCGAYRPDDGVPDDHETDCPVLTLMPRIVAAMDAADDCAGLLLMVLDNQIRNGWVREDSPLLNEPRKALERWHALKGD